MTTISASLLRRWYAMLIDTGLLVTFIVWPAAVLVDSKIQSGMFFFFLLASLWTSYQWCFQRFCGASVGQRLVGYRIVSAETGTPLYLIRIVFAYIGFIFGYRTLLSKNTNNIYWWDKRTHTRAFMVNDPGEPY